MGLLHTFAPKLPPVTPSQAARGPSTELKEDRDVTEIADALDTALRWTLNTDRA